MNGEGHISISHSRIINLQPLLFCCAFPQYSQAHGIAQDCGRMPSTNHSAFRFFIVQ